MLSGVYIFIVIHIYIWRCVFNFYFSLFLVVMQHLGWSANPSSSHDMLIIDECHMLEFKSTRLRVSESFLMQKLFDRLPKYWGGRQNHINHNFIETEHYSPELGQFRITSFFFQRDRLFPVTISVLLEHQKWVHLFPTDLIIVFMKVAYGIALKDRYIVI